jgi:uncharacterized protein (TIGR03067 family)
MPPADFSRPSRAFRHGIAGTPRKRIFKLARFFQDAEPYPHRHAMKTTATSIASFVCRFSILLCMAASVLAQADAKKEDTNPPAEAHIRLSGPPADGKWKPVSAVLGGETLPKVVLGGITLTIKEGSYEVKVAGERHTDKGTTKIDNTTDPPRMTITGTDGPNKDKTFLAIYESGHKNGADYLRVCYDLTGKAFPAKFESPAGTQHYLVEYRRPAPDPNAGVDDAIRQNGTWKPAGAMLGGAKVPPDELKKITLTVKDGAYQVVIEGEAQADKGTVTLDTAATPKRMTITSTEGSNKGKTFLAIYQMGRNGDTDTFRVCYDLSGKAFPAEFNSPKGSQHYLVGYRRAKEAAK